MIRIVGGHDVVERDNGRAWMKLLYRRQRHRMDLGVAQIATRLHARAALGEIDQEVQPLLVRVVPVGSSSRIGVAPAPWMSL